MPKNSITFDVFLLRLERFSNSKKKKKVLEPKSHQDI